MSVKKEGLSPRTRPSFALKLFGKSTEEPTSRAPPAESPRRSPRDEEGKKGPGKRDSPRSPRKSPREEEAKANAVKGARVVDKRGWLRMQMKKLFFVIIDGWLFWFSKEVEVNDATVDWQFLETAKGSLFLSRCNAAKGEKPKDLVIVNPSGDNCVIHTGSEEERDEWLRAVQKVMEVEVQDFSHLAFMEKRGVLKYRNVPKWFVLKDGVLMWFSGENEPEVEGSTTLASATVALGETLDGAPAFVIATLEGKHVIGAESREEAETWASYVKASITMAKAKNAAKMQEEEVSVFTNDKVPQHLGMLTMMDGNKKLFFLLEGSVLQWYSDVTDFGDISLVKKNIRGFISLRADMLVRQLPTLPETDNGSEWKHPLTLCFKHASGKSVVLLAQTTKEQQIWVEKLSGAIDWLIAQNARVLQRVKMAEKEGYLMRGKLKIWAVCRDGVLMTYDSKTTKKAVSTLKLENSGVLEARDKQGFLLFTSAPSLEVFQCVGRKADAQADNFEWFQALLLNIVKCNSALISAIEASEEKVAATAAAGGGGRGAKKAAPTRDSVTALAFQQEKRNGAAVFVSGRKRTEFFFSLRQTTLYWFKSEAELFVKGSQQLCGCHVSVEGKSVSIKGSDEKMVLEFETVDPENARSWGVALQEAIFEADEERGYKKFGFLESKGKKRWVVVSRRHCMWFPQPMKLTDIQNAGAFESVVLADCSLTSYGDSGFVLSERKVDSKVGEKVTVVSFVAESARECAEWMRVLEVLVLQTRPRVNEGIAYSVNRVVMNADVARASFRLSGLGVMHDSQTMVDILELPTAMVMLQEDGKPISGCTALSSPQQDFKLVLTGLAPSAEAAVEDAFAFRLTTGTAMTENVARFTLRCCGSQPRLSPRKPLPHAPLSRQMSKPLPLPPDNGVRSRSESGMVALWTCEMVLYQKSKRLLKHGAWTEVVEDAQNADSPPVLFAKYDLTNLILSNGSPNLVSALLSCLPATELDQVVQAVVNIHASRGSALQLIERFITSEIGSTDQEETLFRTNSNATKMCKFYSMLTGAEYLVARLSDPIQAMFDEGLDCEVDPAKLADQSKLVANQANLTAYVRSVLDSVVGGGAESLPPDLAFICSVLWRGVEGKFGKFKYAAVGGFLFLRFLCPATLTPDVHGILANEVPKELRRTLTLVAKVLQNVSNGVEFGKKEEFMIPFNPLINEQIPRLAAFFESVSLSAMHLTAQSEAPREMLPLIVERSTDTVYKQILMHQKKLQAHETVFGSIAPIIAIVGVPEKLKRALEKQGQIGKAI